MTERPGRLVTEFVIAARDMRHRSSVRTALGLSPAGASLAFAGLFSVRPRSNPSGGHEARVCPASCATSGEVLSRRAAILMPMSSSESPHKFEERKALTEARAKLVALVGVQKAEEIYQQATREASQGDRVDEEAVIAAIERAYDREARIESLP